MSLIRKIWQDYEQEDDFTFSKYHKRSEILRRFIPTNAKSVIDFGAGDMYLGTLLPENVEYYPVDYTRRSDKTIVYDINGGGGACSRNGGFPDITADIAVMAGLLAYLKNPEWFLGEVTRRTSMRVIIAYFTYESAGLFKASNIDARRNHAWINDLSAEDIIRIMRQNGFALYYADIRAEMGSNFCFIKDKFNRNA